MFNIFQEYQDYKVAKRVYSLILSQELDNAVKNGMKITPGFIKYPIDKQPIPTNESIFHRDIWKNTTYVRNQYLNAKSKLHTTLLFYSQIILFVTLLIFAQPK